MKKHGREGDEEEAQRREEQRREVLEPDVDDDEVHAAEERHGDGEEDVADGHRAQRAWQHPQERVMFLRRYP